MAVTASNGYGTVDVSALDAALKTTDAVVLIDVRTAGEYRGVHVPGAISVPLDALSVDAVREHAGENDEVYVICQSGGRGAKACELLAKQGLERVVNVEGGTSAWVSAGLPVVRGKGTISIMRQVQIAAGSLVLLGVTGGFLIHPGFFGLSGFVGAGLLFAGLSDTCGMAILLAKMPWNRGQGASCAS
ncbi:rhodanese-like domain-containing protein [Mucisphaera sp.]|uniref:rhodanese-like domain-containing protein n=1 Tax=Mucisphaera sp. TaxID=2913024 RepID=UPI003D0EDAC9